MNTNEIKKGSNKSFGIVFSIVFFIIALYPLIYDFEIRSWSIIIAIIFLLLGLTNSKILTPLNTVWFKFGILLGKVISPIIMGIIFFLVVTPIGYIMRFLNKDLLNLKYDKSNSYWIKKTGPKSKMKNQF
jgi:hypothetical protein